ncbi:hypothetical protein G6F37_012280 [Rhizopus arrhizus]|nr:hypothetical protein G6F38_012162 [Rhizopus arrhizus]KAG1144564.1 hypothetical protein G6F37_012280 [Rhizopus arrhizus]
MLLDIKIGSCDHHCSELKVVILEKRIQKRIQKRMQKRIQSQKAYSKAYSISEAYANFLEDNHPQSCSQSILLDHIRRFHSGNTETRLALFFLLLRLRPAVHSNNFMQNIYETVDSFGYTDTQ